MNGFYGKKHSKETKEKMSKQRKGKNHPYAKSVIINNIKYYTIKEACEKLNISRHEMRKLI